jgi:RNA polymerase sigma factor (sigma-70 family)
MDAQKRSDDNFYTLLRRVLTGRAPVAGLVADPIFLNRGRRICNFLASGMSCGPEDLFQDVCVKLLKSGARLCPENIGSETAFFSWLFVLTLNLRRDDYRRNGRDRQREVSLDETLSEALSIADPDVGPEVECLRGEFDAFVETLPERPRRAFALRRQGLTYDEIAEALSRDDKSVTSVTVRKWVLDALAAFSEGRVAPEVRKAARRAV